MSDHNQPNSFDNHPDNSGCSNDDFEQVDAPSSGYYYDNHYGDDADGADAVGSGAYYDYDPEQSTEVTTTTANIGEEEAEEDRYAAGASEAESHNAHKPIISLDSEVDDISFDTHSVQPSAPYYSEPVIDLDSYSGEDILAAIAPVSCPLSGQYSESTLSSTFSDDYEYNDSKREYGISDENIPDEFTDSKRNNENGVQYIPDEFNDIKKDSGKSTEECIHDEFYDSKNDNGKRTDESTPDETEPDFYKLHVHYPSFQADSVSNASSSGSQIQTLAAQLEKKSPQTIKAVFQKTIDVRVKDLIYWRNVKKTGVVFGTVLVVLMSLSVFSILSVVAYMSLAVLTVTFSVVTYRKLLSAVQKSNTGHPFKFLLDKDITLTEDKLKLVIETCLKNVNTVLKELRHLFLIEDILDSAKFGLLLWALTYIGSWFSDLSLIIIAFVLVFTVPKLYETYQVQIDNYIGLAKSQINRYLSIIENKVPFLKRKEKAN